MMGVNFSGCSGCSKTGREELAREQRQEAQQEQIDRQQGKAGNKIVDQPENSQRAIDIPEPSGSDSSVSVLSVLYRRCKKSVFLIYTSNEKGTFQGSGFFISPDGVAISNYHVFEDTYQGQERIHLGEDRVYRISRVLRKSQEHDYIIFQVDVPGQVPYLEIAQSLPAVGEEVFTIGNPRGLDQTLSQGIVSGYRRHRKLIQTTTEITHGSSGGPLMNMSGEVIGITTMGIGQANLNFAVNIHLLDIHR
jgi:serine protease Do